jgi:hypothetical protein|uniref:Uncharacterized protein n=1 Tax=Picea glauca TaxID=3330 RepID=A0A117NIX3_PICGL|nr:hypothetical protein ABT39_MTgene472 [Picea glauca]QHR91235.1 hypothetical protein Q903MT_gene5267 [Picea sitchensis]
MVSLPAYQSHYPTHPTVGLNLLLSTCELPTRGRPHLQDRYPELKTYRPMLVDFPPRHKEGNPE